ncbi:alpha-amylase family glycosyl hydrolase [Haloplasma contractile]|uniref:Alpha-amylase maltodextrin protein n=1 Tax=Haloplasma contractile SSD-17B TaxID=1033810 RepID=U2FJH9_9MOLU|nr:alpha-amylase family glycosyl hydrolase [Haloplasma contractile]ERJ12985.1 Alpha-amylase maltodextrin protein [Haloplasma contractile SSD-17B]
MAKETPIDYRNLMIYQVYNRNHNESGTFLELVDDLDRIKDLGTDILYLLPIHPIGMKNKKGSLGCPYSIQDYRGINPEYGTLEDFKKLIEETHKRGMKIMLDIVYNHTSHDSRLLEEHSEWFYRNGNGELANRVGDWWDITDLDYRNKELWDEMIDILKYFANMGVDGYRCDVASFVPVDFWIRARHEVAEINRDFIWLAETLDFGFRKAIDRHGFIAHSDSEMYEAFDITYDYDVMEKMHHYLEGKSPLSDYLERLRMQESIYPQNYVKLRNLENHDQKRIAYLVNNIHQLKIWTSFLFFQKGATMIYAGQEALDPNLPSLFDEDKVDWSRYNEDGIADLIKALAGMKKDRIMAEGNYEIHTVDYNDLIVLSYENSHMIRYGIFNVGLKTIELPVEFSDGEYKDIISDDTVYVNDGKILLGKEPLIFDVTK